MPGEVPTINDPGLPAHLGRWIGTHFRGVKGVDRLLRTLHNPDQRHRDFFRTVARAYPRGPKYHLESRWFNEWLTWFYGSQDLAIHRWIMKNAGPDWVAFDIGMNFGYFTCLLASICKDAHGFEPVGWLAERAQANVELNAFKNVTINELALSDHAGTAQLNLPSITDCNWGTSSLVHKTSSSTVTREVKLETLDSYCSTRKITRLDFMKIDVEGAEHLVLRGGQDTLKRLRPKIIFEYNAESAPEANALLEMNDYHLVPLTKQNASAKGSLLHDVLAIPRH